MSLPCSFSSSSGSGPVGGLVPWPGPEDPDQITDGSLVLAATAPRAGVIVVRATGEIDRLTAPGWRRTLTGAARMTATAPHVTRTDPDCDIGPGDPPAAVQRLVCDLSAVTFLGACGLEVLVEVAELSNRRGVDLRVVASGRPVRRVLGLTGLDRHLTVGPRLDRQVADDLDHDPAPLLEDVLAPRGEEQIASTATPTTNNARPGRAPRAG